MGTKERIKELGREFSAHAELRQACPWCRERSMLRSIERGRDDDHDRITGTLKHLESKQRVVTVGRGQWTVTTSA